MEIDFPEEEDERENEEEGEERPVDGQDEGEEGERPDGSSVKQQIATDVKGLKLGEEDEEEYAMDVDEADEADHEVVGPEESGLGEEEEKEKEKRNPIISPHPPQSLSLDALDPSVLHASLRPGELAALRQALQKDLAEWQRNPANVEIGANIWRQLRQVTCGMARELSEQLRLILEPTLTAKMRGDYRTGKRLNMRKVIPYIATNFRKDKIWLRRSQPSKREYQILLGIDDSASVALGGAGELLREAVATISQALVHLESGEIALVKFGDSYDVLPPIDYLPSLSLSPSLVSTSSLSLSLSYICIYLSLLPHSPPSSHPLAPPCIW